MRRRTDPLLALPDKSGILYIRLYQRMRALILQGSWSRGMRLPSSRTLAADLGISRNTAILALDQLLADGWIETRSRAGTFVSAELPTLVRSQDSADALRNMPSARPPVPFEMAHGAIDAFPFEQWSRLQSKIWSKFVPDLLYESEPAGDPGLRLAIANIVAPTRGISVTADEIVIVSSSLSALDMLAATLPVGAKIIVEDPGYYFADRPFRQRGCEIVSIEVDAEGLDVAAARRAAPDAALVITTAAAQFPLGVPLSPARRRELLAWAADGGPWILDDGFDADARFDGAPPAPSLKADDRHDRIIALCSFSRMLFRSLRLGFITVPAQLRSQILAARGSVDGFVPLPNQLVLREFIDQGLWSAHQRRCRDLHRERREGLIAALNPYLGRLFHKDPNPCGLHLILRPREAPATRIANALRAAGIACTTLGELTRKPPGPDGILLGFAAFSPDVIEAIRPAIDSALRPLQAKAPAA